MKKGTKVNRDEFTKTAQQLGYKTLTALSTDLGLSPSYFSRIFNGCDGVIPKDKMLALNGATGWDWSTLEIDEPNKEHAESEITMVKPVDLQAIKVTADDEFWFKLEDVMIRAFSIALEGERK